MDLHVFIALRDKSLIGSITDKGVETNKIEKLLALNVPAMRENALRAVQKCETLKYVSKRV